MVIRGLHTIRLPLPHQIILSRAMSDGMKMQQVGNRLVNQWLGIEFKNRNSFSICHAFDKTEGTGMTGSTCK